MDLGGGVPMALPYNYFEYVSPNRKQLFLITTPIASDKGWVEIAENDGNVDINTCYTQYKVRFEIYIETASVNSFAFPDNDRPKQQGYIVDYY